MILKQEAFDVFLINSCVSLNSEQDRAICSLLQLIEVNQRTATNVLFNLIFLNLLYTSVVVMF